SDPLSPPPPDLSTSTIPRIVHGLLSASLFPTLLSTVFPHAVYRAQKLKWHAPLPAEELVLCRCDLTKILQLKRRQMLLTFDTVVIRATDGQTVLSGEGELFLKEGGVLLEEQLERQSNDDDFR
ncbi:hypothetical protein TeGR_g9290, partial [Tetraparma gracilis]